MNDGQLGCDQDSILVEGELENRVVRHPQPPTVSNVDSIDTIVLESLRHWYQGSEYQ